MHIQYPTCKILSYAHIYSHYFHVQSYLSPVLILSMAKFCILQLGPKFFNSVLCSSLKILQLHCQPHVTLNLYLSLEECFLWVQLSRNQINNISIIHYKRDIWFGCVEGKKYHIIEVQQIQNCTVLCITYATCDK